MSQAAQPSKLSRPRRASRAPSRLADENAPAAVQQPRLASKQSSNALNNNAGAGPLKPQQSTVSLKVSAASSQSNVQGKQPLGTVSNAANNARRPTFADLSNANTSRVGTDRNSKELAKPSRSRQASAAGPSTTTTNASSTILQPPSSTGTGISRLKLSSNPPSSVASVAQPQVPTKRASRAALGVKSNAAVSSRNSNDEDALEVLKDSGAASSAANALVGLGISGHAGLDSVWGNASGHAAPGNYDDAVMSQDEDHFEEPRHAHKRTHAEDLESDLEEEEQYHNAHANHARHGSAGKVRVLSGENGIPVAVKEDDDELHGFQHDEQQQVVDEEDWTMATVEEDEESRAIIEEIKREFSEELDLYDTTMVSEYASEIFQYMSELEEKAMPNPRYMDHQQDIEWSMRTTLIDWLLQVHLRYHMLPETLWIAINIIDRFLSNRVVSLVKFQLVGVTAMFVAAKYEEIMAPSVDEFVYMTEGGYTREEILKGERIILQSLEFNISPYCSPYTWVRRISKADDYDIQTRTLSKFLMEVTLLDQRFIRAKPSMIAAIGMYLARRMLGGDWSDPFIFFSNYTESQLATPAGFLIEMIAAPDFEKKFVYKKYSAKKFLKASNFARTWAKAHYVPPPSDADSAAGDS